MAEYKGIYFPERELAEGQSQFYKNKELAESFNIEYLQRISQIIDHAILNGYSGICLTEDNIELSKSMIMDDHFDMRLKQNKGDYRDAKEIMKLIATILYNTAGYSWTLISIPEPASHILNITWKK